MKLRIKQFCYFAALVIAFFIAVNHGQVVYAATYPPLSCTVGQHISFTGAPVDSTGKAVVIDFATAGKSSSTNLPAGIVTVVLNAPPLTGTITCVSVGTATFSLTVTNNGASDTTLTESFQVTVSPPPPAVTFGFVFQPPA